MSNDIERELAKILARDNELRDAEASEKRKQEATIASPEAKLGECRDW